MKDFNKNTKDFNCFINFDYVNNAYKFRVEKSNINAIKYNNFFKLVNRSL